MVQHNNKIIQFAKCSAITSMKEFFSSLTLFDSNGLPGLIGMYSLNDNHQQLKVKSSTFPEKESVIVLFSH